MARKKCLLGIAVAATMLVAFAVPNAVAGLVSHWKFDETSGSIAEDSAGDNDGMLINSPTWTTGGKVGGALSFTSGVLPGNQGDEAYSDYVEVPDHATLQISDNITVAAWIYPTAFPKYATIVSKLGAWSNGWWLTLQTPAVGVRFTHVDGSGPPGAIQETQEDGGAVQLNTWTHIAATKSGTEVLFYRNGVQTASKTVTAGIATGDHVLRIGYQQSHNGPYDGLIDEVRVYSHVLDADDVEALYQAGLNLPPVADFTVDAPVEAPIGGLKVTPQTVNLASQSDEVRASYSIEAVDVELDGTDSYDPEEEPIATYAWTIRGGLLDEPLTADTATVKLVLLPGLYNVELIVNDGVFDSVPAVADFAISIPGFSAFYVTEFSLYSPWGEASSVVSPKISLSIPFARDPLNLVVGEDVEMILDDDVGEIGRDTIDVIEGGKGGGSRGKS